MLIVDESKSKEDKARMHPEKWRKPSNPENCAHKFACWPAESLTGKCANN